MHFDVDSAGLTLAAFAAAMDGAGLRGRYWLTKGALLGFCRQGDFIAHDGDIDFGMFADDYDERLPAALAEAGFRLLKRTGRPEDGLTLTFSDGRTKVDIFFHYREPDGFWHAVTNGPPQVRYRYRPFGLAPARLRGVELTIPSPPEAVVEAIYGPDWRLPVRRWHYAYSPYNVEVAGGTLMQAKYRIKNGIWQVKSRLRQAVRAALGG